MNFSLAGAFMAAIIKIFISVLIIIISVKFKVTYVIGDVKAKKTYDRNNKAQVVSISP